MKTFKFLIANILLSLVFNSCLDISHDTRNIKINNKSNGTIYCLASDSDSFKNPYIEYRVAIIDKYHKIKKDTFIYLDEKPKEWESYIKNDCENGKLCLFIISKDSIDKYGWKKILLNNIYTRVYKLNMDEIKIRKWEITY